jgi:hypothetical protein
LFNKKSRRHLYLNAILYHRLNENYRLRTKKILWDLNVIKNGGFRNPSWSALWDVTWQQSHQGCVQRGIGWNSINLEDLTIFRRIALALSSGLRITGCLSCWKEDYKSYAPGTKTHKLGHGLVFYQKIMLTLISKCDFVPSPQWNFSTAGQEDSPGPKSHKKWRIPKSIMIPTMGANLAIVSPRMGATGHRTEFNKPWRLDYVL